MLATAVVGIERAARRNGHKRQSARRDATQWAKIIEAQRQSSLSVVEFCRRRDIAKAMFWYWRKRLVTAKKQELIVNPAQRFLAVPIVAPAAAHIEVELGSLRMRLEGVAAARIIEAIVGRITDRLRHAVEISSNVPRLSASGFRAFVWDTGLTFALTRLFHRSRACCFFARHLQTLRNAPHLGHGRSEHLQEWLRLPHSQVDQFQR